MKSSQFIILAVFFAFAVVGNNAFTKRGMDYSLTPKPYKIHKRYIDHPEVVAER